MTFAEFATDAPIAGGMIEIDDGTLGTTDREGKFVYTTEPLIDSYIQLSARGYPHLQWYRPTNKGDFSVELSIPANATLDQLSLVLGISIDPADTIVSISLLTGDDGLLGVEHLSGALVDLDVAYDVALVLDDSSETGVSLGNTTLEGSNATVIFVNATAGDITPTVTTPNGEICSYGSTTFAAGASNWVQATYYCN